MDDLTQRFVTALEQLHRDRDVEPLVELFSDDATLDKAGVPHGERGQDGARLFWQQYRDVFNDIEAEFRHQTTGDGLAYLEWTSKGSLRDGADFQYEGVSVLEARGDTIDAFRTYYDTAAFLVASKH
ncbi:nuclear transport factor 2 family protein [Mycolicibacterium arenosum]|uniref:Nuclear transport factor 2 family protein n=1 Tax=Mycolicibacterium arenosum TaxID=2952157 RepID=A0ABT1M9S8_9MYCO|nr:nuclear transport factor 2 family protein [Mycolicibacterium sp. CAU 1645]MCP9274542.1 nuclear transport factor 2 family protein [Mycolicibacterium sp. CAU 1645]